MPSSLQRAVPRAAISAVLGLCSGCGATGLAWVGEAHPESAQQQQMMRVTGVSASSSEAAPATSIPATTDQTAGASRPRLSRTITLGEIDVVTTRDGASPAAVTGPSVTVNNYNQVNVVTPAYGYASYGYARSQPSFSAGSISPGQPGGAPGLQPGQNWPAIADHGPSFPYGSAPASPWTRSR